MTESTSVFDSDPTLIAPSQRLAQAHASNNEIPLDDTHSSLSDVSESRSASPQAKKSNGLRQDVNLNDESAFPSLGGGASTKPKSLWGNVRSTKAAIPVASQVVNTADIVTETVKLEASQQETRSLGKSQTGVVVKAVQKKTDTTIQMSTAVKTGTTIFLIKGKAEAVKEARRSLMKELGKKVVLHVLVPNLVRPYIIGAKGRTLKMIIDRTGAKVQLPKREAVTSADQELDPEEMVDITIEGDFEGAAQAKQEIDAIVSERTSSTSLKITSIPSDFYGLLSLQIANLEAGQEVKLKIPSPSFNEQIPVAITISGEKSLVAETKNRLEDMYEDLKRTTIPTSFPVAKKQHKFIANSLDDILHSTGCSVIVPPPSSSSDHITIRGPGANIGAGITLVMEKANSMAVDSLEISKAHPSAANQVQHAADITNYLRNADQIKALEKTHSVGITVPSEAELLTATRVVYDISGKAADSVTAARKAIVTLVNGLTPGKVRRLEIDPLLHKQVIGPKNKNVAALKKQNNTEICFPASETDSSYVVLVSSISSVSSDEITASLDQVESALLELAAAAGSIVKETINIPAKHHVAIMGKNNTTLNAITGGSDSLVRVTFGSSGDAITIRGPKSEVAKVAHDIKEVAQQAETSEQANSYKVEFDFPAQFTKNLIGKGGANITKIRDELGVRIDVGDEGKITCQGPQRNVEEAKSRIVLLGDRLADETTFKLKIPAEFHGQIIGQGGKFVKRLEDKYQVQINFPRSGEDENNDKLDKNEVTVKGGKKGATAAKAEIMELFEYENEHSYTATIQVLQRAVAQIVGKSGSAINSLKDETNTRIDIERTEASNESPDSLVSIVITGNKAQVESAKKSILEVNSEVQDTCTRTLTVDPAFHRNLIGSGGNNIREIVVKAGGPDDAALRARMVRFPRAGVESSEVVLKGPQKVIDKIAKAIEKIVGDASNQHSDTISVPKDQVRVLIGRNGSKKAELESKFSVVIDVPRAEATKAAEVPVKILGAQENVAKATAEISKLVKVPDSETLQIPRAVHRQLAEGGIFIRRLKSDYKVSVDHDGHELPKAKTAPSKSNSTARIDDDEVNEEGAWSVVEIAGSDETGDIPWVLKGDLAQIAKAKKAITTALAQATKQTHVGHLSVPSAKHRYIIGQGGATINSIRESSGTKIDVPRNPGDEVVVIKGSKEGLEMAKALILEATKAPSGNRYEK